MFYLDSTALGIIVGLLLLAVNLFIQKKIPSTSSALTIFINSQALYYGFGLVAFGLTGLDCFLMEKRWILSFAGLALIWIWYDNSKSDFTK